MLVGILEVEHRKFAVQTHSFRLVELTQQGSTHTL